MQNFRCKVTAVWDHLVQAEGRQRGEKRDLERHCRRKGLSSIPSAAPAGHRGQKHSVACSFPQTLPRLVLQCAVSAKTPPQDWLSQAPWRADFLQVHPVTPQWILCHAVSLRCVGTGGEASSFGNSISAPGEGPAPYIWFLYFSEFSLFITG